MSCSCSSLQPWVMQVMNSSHCKRMSCKRASKGGQNKDTVEYMKRWKVTLRNLGFDISWIKNVSERESQRRKKRTKKWQKKCQEKRRGGNRVRHSVAVKCRGPLPVMLADFCATSPVSCQPLCFLACTQMTADINLRHTHTHTITLLLLWQGP